MTDRLNERTARDESVHGPTADGPSASDRQPLLAPETRERIAAEIRRFPQRRTALLPALKMAQAQIGWLPPGSIAEVAGLVGVSHAAANELASFYSMLRLRPGGRSKVEVCVQLPCALAGGEKLLAVLSDALDIAPGEVTPDGSIELIRTAECFGACHRAPMCRVNDEYHEHLTPEATRGLIEALRAGTFEQPGANGNASPPAASSA